MTILSGPSTIALVTALAAGPAIGESGNSASMDTVQTEEGHDVSNENSMLNNRLDGNNISLSDVVRIDNNQDGSLII